MDPANIRPAPDQKPLPLNLLRRDRDSIGERLHAHVRGCMACLQHVGGFRKVRCSVGQDIHRQWTKLDDALARREME